MKKENYIDAVLKEIHCSKEKKKSIGEDIKSDIESALENGEAWDEIERRLGTPKELADEFNDNLMEEERVTGNTKKWIWIGITVSVIIVGLIVFLLVINKPENDTKQGVVSTSQPVKTSEPASAFDESKAKEDAENVVKWFNQDEFQKIIDSSDNIMKSKLTAESLKQAKNQYMSQVGAFQSFTTETFTVVDQKEANQKYGVVQLIAKYEKKNVIYTISFSPDGKLAGFYMK